MPATPILFVSHVVETGGAEHVLLDLLAQLDRSRFAPHVALPGPGPLADGARALGVPTHSVPIGGKAPWRKAAGLIGAARALRGLAAQLGSPVLVATSMIAGYAGVLAQRRGPACVWHLHVVTRSRIARFFLARAAAVIAPSRAATAALGAAARGTVIPNGVAERFFAAAGTGLREGLGLPPGAPLFGIVGRLDPHKGHDVLLSALSEWPGAPAPHLAIAGGELFAASQRRIGGYGAELRQRVAALGLAARVHWLGELVDTAPLLADLDVLVVPSTAPESAPRTIAEAQAAGCPVVASAVGGVPELIDDGRTGVLVAPGDAAGLRAALAALAVDADRRTRLAAAARRHAEAEYRLETFARRCEAVFAAAAGSGGRRAP